MRATGFDAHEWRPPLAKPTAERYLPRVTRPLRFDADYEETVTLADGTRARLRLLRPTDKDELARGLARLSPESQYLRFFTTKVRFTEAELRYLTEFDGWDHLAIGATEIDDDGNETNGIGVGRFVRLPDEPTVAEPAVAVVDDRQGQGLGTMLVRRLMEAAAERGIHRFRSEFLAKNTPMRELFEHVSSQTAFTRDGATVRAEFPLTSEAPVEPVSAEQTSPPEATNPIFEWLRFVAERTVALQQRWLRPDKLREALVRLGKDDEQTAPEHSTEDDRAAGSHD